MTVLEISSAFISSLETGDFEGVRACPKADLHVHTFLGGNRNFIRERTGHDIAPLADILCSMHDWVGEQVGDLFTGATGRAFAIEAAFVQAVRDGVTRIKLGEDVWGITLHNGSAAAASNVMIGRVARMEDHSIRTMVDAGVKVTVNIDDFLMFGSSLSDEFLELFRAGVMTAEELDAVRRQGFAISASTRHCPGA